MSFQALACITRKSVRRIINLQSSTVIDVLTRCRSPGTGTTSLPDFTTGLMAEILTGLVIRHTAKTCASKWADALCDRYFLELWIC